MVDITVTLTKEKVNYKCTFLLLSILNVPFCRNTACISMLQLVIMSKHTQTMLVKLSSTCCYMVFIVSCTSATPPNTTVVTKEREGAYGWFNQGLADDPLATRELKDAAFEQSTAQCTIDKYKVAVPAPSCTQPPAQSCDGLTGFSLGLCRSGVQSQPRCDHSAVNRALDAQDKVFSSCMNLQGWSIVWRP